MTLTVFHLFYNQTVLWLGLQHVIPYLTSPTLIYHDGSDEVDIVARSLSDSGSIVIAQLPETPTSNNFYTIKSTILITKNLEPMIEALRDWSVWQARSRVVMIMQNSTDVRRWIELLWKHTRAADILVLVLSEKPEYFTWFPYKPIECTNVSTIVQLDSSNLFPKKFDSLNGCPLIAVVTPLLPFVANDTHGFETRLFRDFAIKMNMKPVFYKLPPGMVIWTVFDANHRPYAALKLLYESKADLLFGQVSMTHATFPFADFLTPHTSEEYIFFAPGPLEAPRATAIFRAFSLQAWILVAVASVIIYFTFAFIIYFETGKFEPSFLHTIAIVLNVSSNLPPSRTLLMFVVAAYMYSMHMTTAYTSSFIVFLSDVPRESPIRTLEDIVDSNFKLLMHSAFKGAMDSSSASSPLLNALNQPSRSILAPRLNLQTVLRRENVLIGAKIAFTSQLQQDMYYDEYDFPRVLVIRHTVCYTFLSFYVSKGHPLLNMMNKYYIRLIEGGFLGHYTDEVTIPPRTRRPNLRPFSVQNVEGPFVFLGCLLGVCLLAWIGEWIYFWLHNKKKKKITLGPFRLLSVYRPFLK